MNSDLNSALALFQSLYKAQKGDVYTIIERFILVGVKIKNLLSFTHDEIATLLKDTFNIEIPITIIQKCINSHQEVFKYTQNKYVVLKPNNEEVDRIIQEMNGVEEYRTSIITELIQFIKDDKKTDVTDEEREIISQSFFDFIADRDQVQENDYRLFITEFIIRKEKDERFQEFINSMKEGMVIYRGIRYADSPNDNSWDYETAFFLDEEYLFSAFGLNGSFYERCFMEFYDLVQEVNGASNKRGGRNRIRLYYFAETKNDIDKYFAQAARIRRMEERYSYPQLAMDIILSKCKDDVSVDYYKTKFFLKLKELNIEEYKEEIDLSKNKDYLFDNAEFEQAKNKHFPEDQIDDVNEYIQIADYINILRQGKSSYPYEKCRYMFLSASNLTNELSRFIKEYYPNRKTVVITRMNTFTELIWFKLKKGVVATNSSMTFSVVNKAKTIVSGLVHEHLLEQYEEVTNLKETEEIKKAYYANLRNKSYSPDKISSDTITDDIAFINDPNSIEEFKRTIDRLKKQAARSESLEKELAEEKKSKQEILEKLESNEAETEELKAQLQKEKDEKQAMNGRIAMLEENMAKENEQRKKSAVEQVRRGTRFLHFLCSNYIWLTNLLIVLIYLAIVIFWTGFDWVGVGILLGVLSVVETFLLSSKKNVKIKYACRYKKKLELEMSKRGVK